MATTIKLKSGSGAPLAGDLVAAEPAFDLTNKRLYTEDSGGTVIEVGTNPTSLTTGTFTSTGIDDNATSTAITIDSSENVGIGTDSPSSKLHVKGSNSGASGVADGTLIVEQGSAPSIQILSANTQTQSLKFGDPQDGDAGKITYSHSNNYMAFDTSGSEAMRIDSSGNVGIGTASPSSTLHLYGTGSPIRLNIEGTTGRVESRLDNTSGAFIFGIDDSGGAGFGSAYSRNIYSNGAYPMLFWTNNAERMRIDSSGNVGIGTTSPVGILHLKSDDTGVVFQSSSGVNNRTQIFFQDSSGTQTAKISVDPDGGSANVMAFSTGTSERMRIGSSGNVGIGTSSPDQTLHVHKGSAGTISSQANSVLTLENSASAILQFLTPNTADQQIRFGDPQDNGAGYINYSHAASALTFGVNGPERMRIDSSGNLGLGNNDPSSYSFDTGPDIIIGDGTDNPHLSIVSPTTGTGYVAFADGTTGNEKFRGLIEYAHSTDHMGLRTSGTERIHINSSGAVLVGATSASNTTGTGVKLFPEGYGGASTAVGIVGAGSTGANSGFRMYSTGASAYRFYVDYAGTIFATSTSISAISDASLKENVRDLDKGLDTINALQPRRFDWKNGDGNDIMGFIAQEVEEVMPELVHDYKYSDTENKKGLKMGDMVPSMVKAIQELSAQVNELKAEVAALKGA